MKDSITRRHFLETASLAGAGLSLPSRNWAAARMAPRLRRGNPPSWAAKRSARADGRAGRCTTRPRRRRSGTPCTAANGIRGSGKAASRASRRPTPSSPAPSIASRLQRHRALAAALGRAGRRAGRRGASCRPTRSSRRSTSSPSTTPCRCSSTSTRKPSRSTPTRIPDGHHAGHPRHHAGAHGRLAGDLDTILGVAANHELPVIEDACQAHLAEWRGRRVGTWGLAGCFSFQASKNLNSGEGGAVLTNDDAVRRDLPHVPQPGPRKAGDRTGATSPIRHARREPALERVPGRPAPWPR